MIATVVGGTMSAGGANAINMYIDRDIDVHMRRTQRRPLVTGVITPKAAIRFAVGLECVSFMWLWTFVNLLSAVLAVGACLYYVFVYTLWLKRRSVHNVTIGGAAGAAPVLIGWAAVTGGVDWPAIVLFLVVFFWTPPHTWALAIRYRSDYAGVAVPMLPVVATERRTARPIFSYSIVVLVTSLALWPVANMGWIYVANAITVGVLFLAVAVAVDQLVAKGPAL
jgi:protoheme IX farnesyltransferase